MHNSPKTKDQKLIVGLGNPGKRYEDTRHNAGFMFVDLLLEKDNPKSPNIERVNNFSEHSELYYDRGANTHILKPQTFMNLSGKSVSDIARFYKISIENIYVVYDDLDIELGKYKLNQGKSPKQHNGVNSIKASLGTIDFHHLRIGVDNRKNDGMSPKIKGEDFVIMKMNQSELEAIKSCLEEAASELINQLKNTR